MKRFLGAGLGLLLLVPCRPPVARAQADGAKGSRLNFELEECRQGLEVAWSELEAVRMELFQTRSALEAEIARRDELLIRLRGALLQQQERVAALTEELTQARSAPAAVDGPGPDRLAARVQTLEQALDESGEALRASEDGRADAEREGRDLQRELARVRGQLAALEAALAEARTATSASGASASRREARLAKEQAELETRIQERDATIRTLEEERDAQARGARETDREARRMERKVDSLEDDLADAQKLNRELEEVLVERKRELADLKKVMAEQTAMLRSEQRTVPSSPAAEPHAARPGAGRDDAFKLIAEGNRALREQRVEDAEQFFRRALDQDADLVGARLGLANCYYARSELDEAKLLVGELLREDRNNPQALGVAGIIAWQEGDVRLAIKRLEKAVKLAPSDAQLHNYLGIIQYARGRHEEAVASLREAVALDPYHGEAMFNLAVLLATAKVPNLAESRDLYERALKEGSARDEKLEKLLGP